MYHEDGLNGILFSQGHALGTGPTVGGWTGHTFQGPSVTWTQPVGHSAIVAVFGLVWATSNYFILKRINQHDIH